MEAGSQLEHYQVLRAYSRKAVLYYASQPGHKQAEHFVQAQKNREAVGCGGPLVVF